MRDSTAFALFAALVAGILLLSPGAAFIVFMLVKILIPK